MGKIRAAITGVGAYLPDYLLTNDELSRMVDTSDEWIMTRIGIKTRHILKGEALGTSYMGVKAVRNLLEKKNMNPEDRSRHLRDGHARHVLPFDGKPHRRRSRL